MWPSARICIARKSLQCRAAFLFSIYPYVCKVWMAATAAVVASASASPSSSPPARTDQLMDLLHGVGNNSRFISGAFAYRGRPVDFAMSDGPNQTDSGPGVAAAAAASHSDNHQNSDVQRSQSQLAVRTLPADKKHLTVKLLHAPLPVRILSAFVSARFLASYIPQALSIMNNYYYHIV